MNRIFLPIITCVFINYTVTSNAQANQTLSNLSSPTSVNVSLFPDHTDNWDIGSATKSWKNFYLTGSVFNNTTRTIYFNQKNTALGMDALHSNTGNYNTAMGFNTLYSNTTGNNNTGLGQGALNANTTGNNNTASGYRALYFNTEGYDNTGTGYSALYSNTTGYHNTASGSYALYLNTSGEENTASGYYALYSNTTGYLNVANGYQALYSNITGDRNTATGYGSLYSNISGASNTATGNFSMYFNTTGRYNTANGDLALFYNSTGYDNSATGRQALYGNSTGFGNTANGAEAGENNETGKFNTAIGYKALKRNQNKNGNVAIGESALTNLKGGSGACTAIGAGAGMNNGSGSNNVFLGFQSGLGVYTGSYNTMLGFNANMNSGSYTNSTALGNGAIVTAPNQIMLGNTSITSVVAAGSFVVYADTRIKKNIKENVPGLAFINGLRPVTFNYDIHVLNKYISAKNNSEETNDSLSTSESDKAIANKEKKIYTGFVAQEVESSAKKLNYDFSGVYEPQNDKDMYGLSYADFVVPLVKAVQELSKMNDEKDAKIDTLQQQNAHLQKQFNDLRAIVLSIQQKQESCSPCGAPINQSNNQSVVVLTNENLLQQNIPNPFSNSTTIGYTLRQKFTSAQIVITDKLGRTLKSFKISGNGKGDLNVDASTLASGAYQYSLFIDGRLIATKQMVLTK